MDYYIKPTKQLHIPSDNISQKLTSLSDTEFFTLIEDITPMSVSEGKFSIEFWLSAVKNAVGISPITWFDKIILSACIAEQQTGNMITTDDIIWRNLGTNTRINSNMRACILDSINKLRSLSIKIEASDISDLYKSDKLNENIINYLLPCKLRYKSDKLNGQIINCTIEFTDKSPLFEYARIKHQVLVLPNFELSVPIKNTISAVNLKTYLLSRIKYMKHMLSNNSKTSTNILWSTVVQVCELDVTEYHKRRTVEENLKKIFKHFKKLKIIKNFELLNEFNTKTDSIATCSKIHIKF